MTRIPTHPGALLREDVLPALGMSVSAAAQALGVSRQMLHRILAEKSPVTAEMAVRLGKFCCRDGGLAPIASRRMLGLGSGDGSAPLAHDQVKLTHSPSLRGA